jgi:hypothetical protein
MSSLWSTCLPVVRHLEAEDAISGWEMGRCPRETLRFDHAAIRQVAGDPQRAVTHRRPDGSRDGCLCDDGPCRHARDEARNEEGEPHRCSRNQAWADPSVMVFDHGNFHP